jgi:amidase
MTAFPYQKIGEIAKGVRDKTFSPVEIVEAHLRRVHELQPQIGAFAHIDAEGARFGAREAEQAVVRGGPLGPLHGVPLSIKGNIEAAGWPSSAGSLLRKDTVARQDAALVARLKASGAILLGNTNTPEYLMAYETDNLLSGRTSNPWNLAYTAGGSSGGEAAAISSGCSAGGVGSDGGGSIRVPAHFCGICGLKPTPGRIAATGHFPPGDGAFSWIGVVGPMGRTVADVRSLFEVIAGTDPGDALSAPVAVRTIDEKQLRGLRIGILESEALGRATQETTHAVERAAKLLKESLFVLEPLQVDGLEQALKLWWFFFGPVIGDLLRRSVAGQEEQLSSIFQEYLSVSRPEKPVTLDAFLKGCAERDLVRGQILRQMRDVPVLLSPVCSAPAFRHGEGNWKAGTGYQETMRHSQWLNLVGFPGISVPMGRSVEGLPIGVQLIGRPHEEELLLAVAEVLERSRGDWLAPAL